MRSAGGSSGARASSPEELTAAAKAIHDDHPGDTVVIAVGSSSHAMHRVVGSVAVSLARHSAVPLVIVPWQVLVFPHTLRAGARITPR